MYDPPRMSTLAAPNGTNDGSQTARTGASLLAAAVIACVGYAAYENGFEGVFLFDDHVDIDRNPAIRSLQSLSRVVLEQGQSGVSGRPIVALSYAFNYAWCGLETWGWHAVNLAIHIATALFLFGAIRRALMAPPFASRWGSRALGVAFASAAIWVAHPLTTGSVMYLGQRVESLMGMFFAATLYFALRAFAAPERSLWRWLAVVACALGTGCKEVIVGAPLLVLLYDALYVSGGAGAAWRARKGFYSGLFGTWLLIAAWVALAQGRSESVGFGYSEVGVWSYLTTQAWAVAHYARLSLWPSPLVFDYGVQPIVELSRWAPPAAGVLVALALTVRGLAKRSGAAFLGAWWFVILAPTSSVLPIVTELIVEHRAYLPSAAIVLGVVLCVATLLERFVAAPAARKGIAMALFAALCAVAVFATRARNRDYASEIGMWKDVVEKLPENDRGHASYGNDLITAGRVSEAGPHFAEAVRLAPNNGYWRSNLGTWLLGQGQVDAAVFELERSRELLPEYGLTLQNLGSAYNRKGERAKALETWRRALDHGAPMAGVVAKQMSSMLIGEGREAEALDACRAAERAAPDDPEALAALARLLVNAKDPAHRDPFRAAGLALRASMLRGNSDPELFELLGDALLQQGKNSEAAGAFRNAGAVWRAQGRTDRADAVERRAQTLSTPAGAAGG
jgi:tetratricopeptide (TPR) repeat protein